ncbi:hypothetical protein [Sphingobium yanoikuyae]|jgi:hypothetical protein|uniref:Uncharacterized protein n=1 Tax=Sphingobium yanoikuyae TaxID=13690 RepID=A0A9X7U5T4_SPHYA|nr:hypothetical protein [Sphingobium yanoikuyae]QNG43550.1 hypothetical protein H3V42_16410 [Sphingobium yanoikuyae]
MRASSTDPLSQFTVDVVFFSGTEQFATETYQVSATTWYMAEQQALHMSVGSAYDNSRIPDLSRTANVRAA